MTTGDGPFYIEHGDLWKRTSGVSLAPGFRTDQHVASGSEEIGVCYDADNGTLHHIGSAITASDWCASRSKKLRDAGFTEYADALVVISFPIVPETVAEINACLATSGRVLKIRERLTEIAATVGEVKRYPIFR